MCKTDKNISEERVGGEKILCVHRRKGLSNLCAPSQQHCIERASADNRNKQGKNFLSPLALLNFQRTLDINFAISRDA